MKASALFGAGVRRLVDSNIVGVFLWDLDGRILEANDAFLDMLQYGREDLVSGGVRWTDLTPAEWRERDERATADLKSTGAVRPYEKEFFRKDDVETFIFKVAVVVVAGVFLLTRIPWEKVWNAIKFLLNFC